MTRAPRCALVFPPGWTACAGGPHLALPALAGHLRSRGIDATVTDLNHEYLASQDALIPEAEVRRACSVGTLDALNAPYFAVEDRLNALARKHGGTWNLQVGFDFDTTERFKLPGALRLARTRCSPFSPWLSRCATEIVAGDPDVVGLSIAALQQLIPGLEFVFGLRDAGFEGWIVLGGNTIARLHTELSTAEILHIVDGLVPFDGERVLQQVCEAATQRAPLASVPGVTSMAGGFAKTTVSHREDKYEVRALVAPDFSDVPVGGYAGVNYLPLYIGRGCYYGKCTFCAIPYGWGERGYDGARSVEAVASDMRQFADIGFRRFKFVDEALLPAHVERLARLILAEGCDVEWEGYARLEPIWHKGDFLNLAARAGFRKGYFGLEVLPSDRRMHLVKADAPRPEELLAVCADYGIRVHLFCMFGYPGTTVDDARRTTDFVLQYADLIDSADFFPWTLAKHTVTPSVDAADPSDENLRLEFTHRRSNGVLSSGEIVDLATKLEEVVWDTVPRLVHPTYRMVSPWRDRNQKPLLTEERHVAIAASRH